MEQMKREGRKERKKKKNRVSNNNYIGKKVSINVFLLCNSLFFL